MKLGENDKTIILYIEWFVSDVVHLHLIDNNIFLFNQSYWAVNGPLHEHTNNEISVARHICIDIENNWSLS